MRGTVVSLNVNRRGGVPKHPVELVKIKAARVKGDKQRGPKHGGPDRAVTLFSEEVIHKLREEGHSIDIGTTGENITVRGIEWDQLVVGCTVIFDGGVVLEISRDAPPCKKISGSFKNEEFKRISYKLHPGWSRMCARVLNKGKIAKGEGFEVREGSAAET